MKNQFTLLLVACLCLMCKVSFAQSVDSNFYNYGIWQTFGDPISRSASPELNGRLCNFSWKNIEPQNNVWDWTAFDSDLTVRAQDTLPIIFMVYTEEDAPDWLYTNGVPKVAQKDANGNVVAYAPYYMDPDYKYFFERMISTVRQHLDSLPSNVRNKIIAVQGCYGSTGDYISYKGTVDPQYQISNSQFYALFQEFSQYYYDAYSTANPKIYLLSNPKNTGSDQMYWLIQNCPGSWIKTGTLGKGYQLNDEVTKYNWLYPIINLKQNGNYVRARSEIIGTQLSSGWWLECPYKNMFALMNYCIFWGVDWSNQGTDQLNDPLFDSAFSYYNKYAGQKDAASSTVAMCFLKDAIDASDSVRFPAATYGTVAKTVSRFNNVLAPFKTYGAKLEDPNSAILNEMNNLGANGINDVGWGIFSGNYDRFIHQINANSTSAGYWNVQSKDTATMYGRFARGFDLGKGKNALYFDVDSSFLNYSALDGQYPVMLEVTYLDNGTGSWQLFYDGKANSNTASVAVTCSNSGVWKKASVTIKDAYFGNRASNGSDFYIKSTGSSNVLFSVVELTRPNASNTNIGLATGTLTAFDTICVNSISPAQPVTVSGMFLNNSQVTIGPSKGFKFSTSQDAAYSDSVIINNYGASFKQVIYIEFAPAAAGTFNNAIPVKGGGVQTVYLNAKATALASSPQLSANITNVTCYNAKNGMIDLVPSGGTGPFTFSWTNNTNNFKSSTEDISNLIPSTYSVVVTSKAGCVTNASYTITQPDVLVTGLSADSMICKGGSTIMHVSATGGTQPYTGTGNFVVSAGFNSFIVTDINGCSDKESLSVPNGTLQAPSKPSVIMGDSSDAVGVCGAGNFNYSIAPVADATSYTWSSPSKSNVSWMSNDGTTITLNTQSSFAGGTLSVTANNVCGSSNAQSKTISITPGKPGTVTGPVSVKTNQTGLIYTVPAVNGLTYTWNVPGAAKIISGQNTASITVTWGGISGNVSVKANNNCGSSSNSILNVQISSSLSSQLASTASSSAEILNAMITPNPAHGVAMLKYSSAGQQNSFIKITNVTGEVLFNKPMPLNTGLNNIPLDLSAYNPGMYFVSVYPEHAKSITLKLLVH